MVNRPKGKTNRQATAMAWSLSETIREIGSELLRLRVLATQPPGFEEQVARSTTHTLESIQRMLKRRIQSTMRRAAYIYAVPSFPIVVIGTQMYSSAHAAVVSQATSFMTGLWVAIDPESYHATRSFVFTDGNGEDVNFEALQAINDGTGFDAKQVVNKWDDTKAFVEKMLTPEWSELFKPLIVRIDQERAWSVANKMPAPKDILENLSPAGGGKASGKRIATPGTRAVLKLLKQGKSNEEIANATDKTAAAIRRIRSEWKADRFET